MSITPSERITADGYSYVFKLGGNITILKAGTISGRDVNFKLAPADTEDFTTGFYFYQIFAEKDGDRYLLENGRIGVSAQIGETGAFDGRSVAERIIDAIDAVLEGRATTDQQSYAIQSGQGSRSLSRIPVLELRELRKTYAALVAAQNRAKNGESILKQHRFAFVCE